MQHYPLDVAHSFWAKMAQLAASGRIASIGKVRSEVSHYQGDLYTWMQAQIPAHFFEPTTGCMAEYARTIQWAESKMSADGQQKHYLQQARADFADNERADAWLVAHAMHEGLTLVTYETADPRQRNRVKIPDACRPFGVPCINVVNMFRILGENW